MAERRVYILVEGKVQGVFFRATARDVARSLGVRVLAISLISNVNRPDCMAPILIDDILRVSNARSPELSRLLGEILQAVSGRLPALTHPSEDRGAT